MIEDVLKMIKEQTGLDLKLFNNAEGLKRRKGKKYFNVSMGTGIFCHEYNRLESFAQTYGLISLEINGRNRVAIYIN